MLLIVVKYNNIKIRYGFRKQKGNNMNESNTVEKKETVN